MTARMRQSQIFKFLNTEDPNRKASDHYAGHEERILGHIGRIHNEAGPIPTCEYFRKTKTAGPHHVMGGCACKVCEKKRRLVAMSKGYKYKPRSRRKMGRRLRSKS